MTTAAQGTTVRLVAGLGNPGRDYRKTRHNAGFWFADALADKLGAAFEREARFAGEIARLAADLRLLKPTTYMNDSGRSVAGFARFHGIAPAQIVIVHDELDLAPGTVKMKLGGGVAGHNGLKDVRAQLGTPDFWRLRFGIGHPRDSELTEQAVHDYVLKPPRSEERDAILRAIDRALEAWPAIAAGDFERAMLQLHTKPRAPGEGTADAGPPEGAAGEGPR